MRKSLATQRHQSIAALFALLFMLNACSSGDKAVDGPGLVGATDVATGDGQVAQDGGAADTDQAAQDAGITDAGQPDSGQTQDDTWVWQDSSTTTDAGGTVSKVVALTIQPASATLPLGSQISLTAVAKREDGTSDDVTDAVTWTSDDAKVVQVNSAGVAVAVSVATANITAELEGITGKAQLTVAPQAVISLAISPAKTTVGIGGSQSFQALATLAGGTNEDVTSSASWSIDSTSIATINANGVIKALKAGTTTVRAKVSGQEASAQLTVKAAQVKGLSLTPAGASVAVKGTLLMSLTAIYDDGTAAAVTAAATWSSSAPGTAQVSASGVVIGLQGGVAVISASFQGFIASRAVTVFAPSVKLSAITITPTTVAIAAGTGTQFKAMGSFSDGSTQDLTTTVTWSVSDATVASVSNAPTNAGFATSLQAGSTTIKASFQGISGSAKLSVSAATLASFTIKPATISVPAGASAQLEAIGTYSDGKKLNITQKATWTSTPAGVATVSNGAQAGLVQGTKPGQADIVATVGKLSAKASVSVLASVLTKIAITPANASVTVGAKKDFVATGIWSDGSTKVVTDAVVWTVDNNKLASVDNSKGKQGQLTALAPGKIAIMATIGSVKGSVDVTLSAPTITKLIIGPNDPTRKAGQSIQFWVVAEFSNGKSVNVTQQATWTTSNPAVASINTSAFNTALVQAKSAGKSTITATFGGSTASSTLTVTTPEVTSLQVTPAIWSVAAGLPMQFQAVAVFSDNSTQNVTFQAQWSSSNTSIAQIGNKGGGPGGPPNKGRVQTKQPGVVKFTALFQGLKASATLTVTSAKPTTVTLFPGKHSCTKGELRNFQATLLFSDGTSQNVNNPAAWTSSNPKVAAALNGNGQKGIVQCLSAGTVTITASVSAYKGSASLEVKAATVKSLQIQPALVSVAVGVPVKYDVAAVMSDGTTQNVSWQATFVSSDATVATVFNGGGAAGWTQTLKPGEVTITATWGGKSVSAKLVVKKAEVKSIEISPTQVVVVPGTYVKLQAVAILTDNTTQQITPAASWTSSSASVATVFNGAQGNPQANQNKGLVQTIGAGKATISATWGGKTGSTTITVQKVALKELQVTPFAPVLPMGFVTQLRATALFTDLSTQDMTAQVSWTSSDSSVAAVGAVGGQKGRVTPLKKGTATITATWNGGSGKTLVQVTDAKLQKVTVTAAKPTLAVQETMPLKAIGLFSGGLTLDITGYATWLTGDWTVVGVSNAAGSKGQAKGLKVGTSTITAIRDGVQGQVALQVK